MKLNEGLLSVFSNDESVNFFTGDTLKKSVKDGDHAQLLPMDSVRAICSRHKADMLLSLDSMNIFFDWETVIEEDSEGNKSISKDFYLYTRFFISLYSSGGSLIIRSEVAKSSFYKSRIALLRFITIEPSVAKAKKDVEIHAFQAGQEFTAKFYTQNIKEIRKIYTGKPFKESNHFIKIKDWNKANEILQQLLDSPDPKIALKAKHNLSVVKEAKQMGDH